MGDVLLCQECGNPWGIIGTSGADTLALVAAIDEWFTDRWAWTVSDLDDFPVEPLYGPPPLFEPRIWTEQVAHITKASAVWLSEYIGIEGLCDPPVWQAQEDIPDWWFRPRARTALRVDCCDLGPAADQVIDAAMRGTATTVDTR